MRLLALALALPLVVCGAEVRIPSAPEAAFADMEAETNAVICAADADESVGYDLSTAPLYLILR